MWYYAPDPVVLGDETGFAAPRTCEECLDRFLYGLWWESTGAVETLLGYGAAALPALCRGLVSPSAEVRWRAALALGRLGDPRPTPGLCRTLRDPEPAVRAGAAEALGMLADPRGLAPLVAAADDSGGVVRAAVTQALGRYDRETVLPLVLRLLWDPEPEVQARAAAALAHLEEVSAIPALCELLSSASVVAAVAAARALGCLKGGHAVGEQGLRALMVALRAGPEYLSCAAADALVAIGGPAVPGLCRVLDHVDGTSRIRVAQVLQEMAIRNPAIALRAALPVLARRSRRWLGESAAGRILYRDTIHWIEVATASRADLPLPTRPPDIERTQLPVVERA